MTVIEFNQNVIRGHTKSIHPPANIPMLFYTEAQTKCSAVHPQNYTDDSSHAINEPPFFSFFTMMSKSEFNNFPLYLYIPLQTTALLHNGLLVTVFE